MAIVSLLVLIAAYLGVFYLGIRWALAGPVLACEGRGIIESLRRSWTLVEGRWWRTFGILLLMGLVTEIVLGALSSPVFFFGIGRITRDLVRPSARPNLAEHIGSIGPVFMLCGMLVFVLLLMISPVYTTVIYFDARARNGEFEEPDPNVDIQIVGEW